MSELDLSPGAMKEWSDERLEKFAASMQRQAAGVLTAAYDGLMLAGRAHRELYRRNQDTKHIDNLIRAEGLAAHITEGSYGRLYAAAELCREMPAPWGKYMIEVLAYGHSPSKERENEHNE